MTDETQLVVVEIEQTLEKENLTRKILDSLKVYKNLSIDSIEDRASFNLIKDARLQCKNTRVAAQKICKKGREKATEIQKAWIDKEKEIVAEIEEVENYLKEKEQWFEEENQRVIREKKEAEMKIVDNRVVALHAVGDMIDYFGAKGLTEDAYVLRLAEATTKYAEKLEAERLEKERIEQQAREQEAERIRLEEERLKMQAERDAMEAEKREIEEQKKRDAEAKLAEEAEKKRLEDLEEARKQGEIKAQKELEEKARLEAIEKQKREDHEKAEQARQEALKPDKEKLANFARQIQALPAPELATDEARQTLADARKMIHEGILILER